MIQVAIDTPKNRLRLPDIDATALELDVHHRQAVDEYGHVVAVGVRTTFRHILVDDLQGVAVGVGAIYDVDILCGSILTGKGEGAGLLHHGLSPEGRTLPSASPIELI